MKLVLSNAMMRMLELEAKLAVLTDTANQKHRLLIQIPSICRKIAKLLKTAEESTNKIHSQREA